MSSSRIVINESYGKIIITVFGKYGIDINTENLPAMDGIFLTWKNWERIENFINSVRRKRKEIK